MKIKTQDLTGPALDWAVAKCEQLKTNLSKGGWLVIDAYENEHLANPYDDGQWQRYSPSTNWSQGGPIIEREHITLRCYTDALWEASIGRLDYVADGPTPLVAAMRCYVASKLGDTIEIPEELK